MYPKMLEEGLSNIIMHLNYFRMAWIILKCVLNYYRKEGIILKCILKYYSRE